MEYLGITALFIIVGLIFFVIMLLIDAGVLHFATYCVSIPNRSFGKALLSSFLSTLLSLLVGTAFAFIPYIGLFSSFGAGLLLSAVTIMTIYQTIFVKALLADLIRKGIGFMASVLIALLIALTIGFGAIQNILMSPTW